MMVIGPEANRQHALPGTSWRFWPPQAGFGLEQPTETFPGRGIEFHLGRYARLCLFCYPFGDNGVKLLSRADNCTRTSCAYFAASVEVVQNPPRGGHCPGSLVASDVLGYLRGLGDGLPSGMHYH